MAYFVDITDSSFAKIGAAPLTSASSVKITRRLDRAGDLSMDLPAADPRAVLIVAKRIMRAYARRTDTSPAVEYGSATIDAVTTKIGPDDAPILTVSGDDLLGELANRTVGTLELQTTANPMTVGAALTALTPFLPSGWTLDATTYLPTGTTTSGSASITSATNTAQFVVGDAIYGAGIPAGATVAAVAPTTITLSANATANASGVALYRNRIYLKFQNESLLEALNKVASAIGEHFRRDRTDPRKIVWLYSDQHSSGIRAVMQGESVGLASNTAVCIIESLEQIQDTHSAVTRIYARGGGNESAAVTLANATDTPPAGYTRALDTSFSPGLWYLKHDASDAANRIDGVETFKDVAVLGSGVAHGQSASNQLQNTTYTFLRTHLPTTPAITYRISVSGLRQTVDPGTTLQAVYTKSIGSYRAVNVNATLLILEVTEELTADGARPVSFVVSTVDRWPETYGERLDSALSTVATMDRHLQKAAQSMDADHAAAADTATTAASATSVTGVTVASTKTLTVNNSLTLAGTDGKTLTLTGSLTASADTTITGGGTLALGGFTGTLPATGTLALLSANTFTSAQVMNETDAGTTNVTSTLQIAHLTSGTPAANFGINFVMRAHTSNRTNSVQAQITSSWVVATNGSQTARLRLLANDAGGGREGLRVEATGSAAALSFYGGTARVQAAAYTLAGTVTRTMPTDPSVAYTGAADGEAKLADLNSLRSTVSSLIGIVRQLIQDLNATTGVGLVG